MEGVLHRTTAPNLKALQKMIEVKDKLQGVTEGIMFHSESFSLHIGFVACFAKISVNIGFPSKLY